MHKQLTNLSHNQSVIIIPTKTHILIRIYEKMPKHAKLLVKVHIYLDYVMLARREIVSQVHGQSQVAVHTSWDNNKLNCSNFNDDNKIIYSF